MNQLIFLLDRHLLVPVTSAYLSGISLYGMYPQPGVLFFISTIAASCACLLFSRCRARLLAIIFLALAFFIFGIIHADRRAAPKLPPHHIVHHLDIPQETVVFGILRGKVTQRNGLSRAQIDVSFIRTDADTPLTPVEGRVLLTLKGAWPACIRPGDSLAVRTTLQLPPVINTPGTFDYRAYLARRTVFLTGFVSHPAMVRQAESIDASLFNHSIYRIELLRTMIGDLIESSLPERTAAIYQALLIGDRSTIGPEDLETFMRAGIMHLLAISGMHLGLLALLLYYAINWLLRRSPYLMFLINVRKAALLLLFPALFFYALMTGANPPVVRSLIMVSAFILSFSIDRFHPPLAPLTGAAFLILLFDPLAALSPSFQLSFAAVASLIVLTPKLFSYVEASVQPLTSNVLAIRLIRPVVAIAIVTVVATVGTLPLMLYHFNRISLVALPGNLLVQPLICLWSLPIGIVSLLCSVFSLDAAQLLLKAGAFGIDGSLAIAEYLSGHENTQLWLPDPPVYACALYYCALIIAGFGVYGRPACLAGVPMLASAMVLFCLPALGAHVGIERGGTVSILDVGHGSAGLVEMSSGHTILIDGGAKSAPGYDCGERIIAPYLWQRRLGHIDDIIITHDDADHYNGIETIIRRFRPDRLILPSVKSPKHGLQRIVACAIERGVEVVVAEHRTAITRGNEKLLIFPAETAATAEDLQRHASEDDKGLVLKFVANEFSVLFPGDITSRKEEEIAARLDVSAKVLLSPHHGSSSSNSLSFLRSVNPDLLIFSANDHGSGLFPSAAALQHAESIRIETHTTSVDGTVLLSFSPGSGYRIDRFSRSAHRFFREG